jgi:hypothetical protein
VREGTEPVTGTAIVKTGPEFEPYRDKVRQKYGMQYRAIQAMGKVRGLFGSNQQSSAAVVITLD